MTEPVLVIDGRSLTLQTLRSFEARRPRVELAAAARGNMTRSVAVVREAVSSDRVSYGITTGFGAFANQRISPDQVRQLQLNLVRSHACGLAEPLPAAIVRRMLLLKANSLATGISGVRIELDRKSVV